MDVAIIADRNMTDDVDFQDDEGAALAFRLCDSTLDVFQALVDSQDEGAVVYDSIFWLYDCARDAFPGLRYFEGAVDGTVLGFREGAVLGQDEGAALGI